MLVYPVATDSPDLIREHRKKHGYSLESIRDTGQTLVKHTGVTVTPEVAVMAGERMVYRGRIDDRYVNMGRARPRPTQRDLENALSALIAGTPIATRRRERSGASSQIS